jgi:hypothetical protein
MCSDKSAYYTYKYAPFVCGGIIILTMLLMHVFPENSTFNDKPGPPDLWSTLILVLIALVFILIPFLYMDKLVRVELSSQHLNIRKDNEVVPIEWAKVEKVEILPFFFPPLYKLKLKNYDGYFLFNTGQSGAYTLFFVWDWSEMGSLIKKKKKELGI